MMSAAAAGVRTRTEDAGTHPVRPADEGSVGGVARTLNEPLVPEAAFRPAPCHPASTSRGGRSLARRCRPVVRPNGRTARLSAKLSGRHLNRSCWRSSATSPQPGTRHSAFPLGQVLKSHSPTRRLTPRILVLPMLRDRAGPTESQTRRFGRDRVVCYGCILTTAASSHGRICSTLVYTP